MNNIGSTIVKGFMWVVGFASLGYGIYFLSIHTSDWPQVEAVVTSVKEGPSDDFGNPSYTTDFEFEVDGAKYQASTSDYYAEGEKITIYYDPNNPSQAITSRGELGSLGCIGVGFGLFAIGGMAWGAIKARRKTEIPAAT